MPLRPPETRPKPIPKGDGFIALLLPLAVAITGSRLVRWLFRDLQGILSTGELLASGLAVGAFFLTQLTLGLRLAGARWERALTAIIMVWAVGEVVLLVRRWRRTAPATQGPISLVAAVGSRGSDLVVPVPSGRSARPPGV